jgi:exodeoxyribonuclease VIII
MMLRHVMVDLETMGTRVTSAIIAIGVSIFDEGGTRERFYTPVSLDSCLSHGLTQDASTAKWWYEQSEDARSHWDVPNPPALDVALRDLQEFLEQHTTKRFRYMWGNGADFDIAMLAHAHSAIGAQIPWEFWNVRCFRTMKNVLPIVVPPRKGTHHMALDDAMHQVDHLCEILRKRDLLLE